MTGNLSDNCVHQRQHCLCLKFMDDKSFIFFDCNPHARLTACCWQRKYKVLLTTCKGFCFLAREKLVSLGFSLKTKSSNEMKTISLHQTLLWLMWMSNMVMWKYVGVQLAKYCLLRLSILWHYPPCPPIILQHVSCWTLLSFHYSSHHLHVWVGAKYINQFRGTIINFNLPQQ